MIGRGDGDGVNIFVLKQLANITVAFWPCQTHLLHVAEALVQNAFIHIAQSGNLRSWHTLKPVEVIVAATSHSANRHAHTIICAEYLPTQRKRGRARSDCLSRCLDKVTPIDRHSCRLSAALMPASRIVYLAGDIMSRVRVGVCALDPSFRPESRGNPVRLCN